MSVEVIDFGCRLNLAEGATMARELAGVGDLVIINSCAVTAQAERQAATAIRQAARRRPGVRIVVTGCAAVTSPARFAAMPEVAMVVAKDQLRSTLPAMSGPAHARLFVEVQNGCDHDCTFCVTTLARGPARSLDPATIVAAIVGRVASGQSEVVLTGVDLTSYRPSLGELVRIILREVPDLARLRLSSLDPAEVDAPLFDCLATEPRVMPHAHLSLQSGNALVLKRMKRRHSPGQVIDLVERLRAERPDVTIGADLIAGFPTENHAAHGDSLAIIAACDIAFGHVFPYSPRPGTAAARMPQVDPATARARAAELRAASRASRARLLAAMVGTTQPVLIERDGRGGHAPNFATVALSPSAPAMATGITQLEIVGMADATLLGAAR